MGTRSSARRLLSPTFTAALEYAAELHADQERKGPPGIPYVGHLLGVASLVLEHGGTETQAIAALLHDALEDRPHDGRTEQEIAERFGDAVVAIVRSCTDSLEGSNDRSARTWRERKTRYLSHLRHVSAEARLVALCDKLYNARAIVADQQRMGNRVWRRFNAGKVDTLWYYEELVAAFLRCDPVPTEHRHLTMQFERTVGDMAALAGGTRTMVHVPSRGPADWRPLLAQPLEHWKPGRSAHAIAHAWERAGRTRSGLPAEVAALLSQPTALRPVRLVLAIPEHQVPIRGGSRPSQNDVWALVRGGNHLISIAVEGKVDEPFDETVEEWLRPKPGKETARTNKPKRLEFLTRILGLHGRAVGHIRYQFLHRAASAIIEAERFGAHHAVMLVHSFDRNRTGFDDFAAFAQLFGLEAEVGKLLAVPGEGSMRVYLGWAAGG
jgi:hypothetical protein